MKQKAIVIGAGFGGIAAALRLRARGYEVQVIERQDQPGGRATVYQRNGFTFDAGPTIITAPFLLEELFRIFNRSLDDYVDIRPIDPWYRIRFHDGSVFNYRASLEDTIAEIRRFEPSDVNRYLKFLDKTKKIYQVGFEQLGDQPFSSFWCMLKVLPNLLSLDSYLSVYQQTAKFLKNPKLRQVFSIHPLLIGGNPFTTTSIYSLIHYLERQGGVHFAMGGTGMIVNALVKLMTEVGIKLSLGQTVKEILVKDGKATSVRLSNDKILQADIIVANADPPYVYRNMISPKHRRKWTDSRIQRLQYSMGLFVLYFGTTRTYPELAHHEILLGPRYKGLIKDIFCERGLASDLSLYLHVPTRTDPSLAPAGCEAMYALVPVPNLRAEVDWEVEGPRLRDRVLEFLGSTVCPGLKDHIVEDFFVTPRHFQQNLLSLFGTGFSIQPLLRQSAYFRFHNRSEDIENLYFVGAGTHPGAGVPGVLTSAKVLEHVIFRDQPRNTNQINGHRGTKTAEKEQHLINSEREPASSIMARYAKTFTWAACLLPPKVKEEVQILYAFCRYVDNLADCQAENETSQVQLEQICQDLKNGDSDIPIILNFLRLSRLRKIPLEYALELVAGVASDLGRVRILTMQELVQYCYRVASTVGVMMCEVLGVKTSEARLYAIDLGIAMQLTNIARDLFEDFENDRIYLPEELVSEAFIQATLREKDSSADRKVYSGIESLLSIADKYYRSADRGIRFLPIWARWSIIAASRNYETIGILIRRRGPGYWFERTSTSTRQKISNTLAAGLAVTFKPTTYWNLTKRVHHQSSLHHALVSIQSAK